MGQEEILKYLRKVRRWTSSKEMQEELGKSNPTVNNALKRLVKYGEVEMKIIKRKYVGLHVYRNLRGKN